MTRKLSTMVLAAALLMGISACNSGSDDNPSGTILFTDIVTYNGTGTGGSTFTFNKEGDSPTITLTSSQSLSTADFKSGSRIIIQYAPESGVQYQSGPITLVAAANIEGQGQNVAESTAEQAGNWNSDPINVSALFRAGDYLNVQFTGALGTQTAVTKLVVDANTLDSDYPVLHLIYGPHTGLMDKTYLFYGSWNISPVWNRSSCKGIKVLYKNAGGAIGGSVTITKTVSGPIKPGDLTNQ